jgi:hypothetical protein
MARLIALSLLAMYKGEDPGQQRSGFALILK